MSRPSDNHTTIPGSGTETASTGVVSDWLALAELVASCSQLLRGAVAARAQTTSITEPQFALLWNCSRQEAGVSQSDLAAGLALSAAHVSGLVEQLSNRSLIVGRRAAKDRRRQIWRLTDEGRSLVEHIARELLPWCATLDAELGRDKRQQIETALRRLVAGLQDASNRAQVVPLAASTSNAAGSEVEPATPDNRADRCAGDAA